MSEITIAQGDVNSANAEVNSANNTSQSAAQELSSASQQLTNASTNLSNATTSLSTATTNLNTRTNELNQLRDQATMKANAATQKQNEINTLTTQITAKTTELNTANEALNEKNLEIEEQTNVVTEATTAVTEATEAVTEAQTAVSDAQTAVSDAQGALSSANDQMSSARGMSIPGPQYEDIKDEDGNVTGQRLTNGAEIAAARTARNNAIQAAQDALDAARDQLEAAQQQLETAQADLETKQEALQTAQQELEDAQIALNLLQEALPPLQEAVTQKTQELTQLQTQLEPKQLELNQLRQEQQQLNQQVEQASNQINGLQEAVNNAQERVNTAQQQVREAQQTVTDAQARVNSSQESVNGAQAELDAAEAALAQAEANEEAAEDATIVGTAAEDASELAQAEAAERQLEEGQILIEELEQQEMNLEAQIDASEQQIVGQALLEGDVIDGTDTDGDGMADEFNMEDEDLADDLDTTNIGNVFAIQRNNLQVQTGESDTIITMNDDLTLTTTTVTDDTFITSEAADAAQVRQDENQDLWENEMTQGQEALDDNPQIDAAAGLLWTDVENRDDVEWAIDTINGLSSDDPEAMALIAQLQSNPGEYSFSEVVAMLERIQARDYGTIVVNSDGPVDISENLLDPEGNPIEGAVTLGYIPPDGFDDERGTLINSPSQVILSADFVEDHSLSHIDTSTDPPTIVLGYENSETGEIIYVRQPVENQRVDEDGNVVSCAAYLNQTNSDGTPHPYNGGLLQSQLYNPDGTLMQETTVTTETLTRSNLNPNNPTSPEEAGPPYNSVGPSYTQIDYDANGEPNDARVLTAHVGHSSNYQLRLAQNSSIINNDYVRQYPNESRSFFSTNTEVTVDEQGNVYQLVDGQMQIIHTGTNEYAEFVHDLENYTDVEFDPVNFAPEDMTTLLQDAENLFGIPASGEDYEFFMWGARFVADFNLITAAQNPALIAEVDSQYTIGPDGEILLNGNAIYPVGENFDANTVGQSLVELGVIDEGSLGQYSDQELVRLAMLVNLGVEDPLNMTPEEERRFWVNTSVGISVAESIQQGTIDYATGEVVDLYGNVEGNVEVVSVQQPDGSYVDHYFYNGEDYGPIDETQRYEVVIDALAEEAVDLFWKDFEGVDPLWLDVLSSAETFLLVSDSTVPMDTTDDLMRLQQLTTNSLFEPMAEYAYIDQVALLAAAGGDYSLLIDSQHPAFRGLNILIHDGDMDHSDWLRNFTENFSGEYNENIGMLFQGLGIEDPVAFFGHTQVEMAQPNIIGMLWRDPIGVLTGTYEDPMNATDLPSREELENSIDFEFDPALITPEGIETFWQGYANIYGFDAVPASLTEPSAMNNGQPLLNIERNTQTRMVDGEEVEYDGLLPYLEAEVTELPEIAAVMQRDGRIFKTATDILTTVVAAGSGQWWLPAAGQALWFGTDYLDDGHVRGIDMADYVLSGISLPGFGVAGKSVSSVIMNSTDNAFLAFLGRNAVAGGLENMITEGMMSSVFGEEYGDYNPLHSFLLGTAFSGAFDGIGIGVNAFRNRVIDIDRTGRPITYGEFFANNRSRRDRAPDPLGTTDFDNSNTINNIPPTGDVSNYPATVNHFEHMAELASAGRYEDANRYFVSTVKPYLESLGITVTIDSGSSTRGGSYNARNRTLSIRAGENGTPRDYAMIYMEEYMHYIQVNHFDANPVPTGNHTSRDDVVIPDELIERYIQNDRQLRKAHARGDERAWQVAERELRTSVALEVNIRDVFLTYGFDPEVHSPGWSNNHVERNHNPPQ